MISFTCPAFILRSRDVGETDRLYSILTRDRGKLDVIAKGIRKQESKLQSSAQALYELEAYIIAQRRFTLGGVVILESYPNIHASLSHLWAAQHIAEVVDMTIKQEHPDKGLYAFFKAALQFFEQHPAIPQERLLYVVCAFDIQLLEYLGVRPQLHENKTAEPDTLFSLLPDGLHENGSTGDRPHRRISKEIRSLLRFAQKSSFKEVSAVAIDASQAKTLLSVVQVFFADTDAEQLKTTASVKQFINT